MFQGRMHPENLELDKIQKGIYFDAPDIWQTVQDD